MSNKLKTFVIAISALLAVILLVSVVIVSFFDANDFKPEIESIVRRHTGKKLIIKGDLELSLFPWLGVSTGKLLIVDPADTGQQPLATIDEGNLKVKLLPLLRKKIEISTVILKNPEVFLRTDKQGKNNWETHQQAKNLPQVSEGRASDSKKSTKETGGDIKTEKSQIHFVPEELIIAGVSIENGKLLWIDERKTQQTEINRFDFNIDTLAFDEAAPFELSFELQRQHQQPVQVSSKGLVTIKQDFNQLELNSLEINSLKQNISDQNKLSISMRSQYILYDRASQQLQIPELITTSGAMKITAGLTASQITKKPIVRGTIAIVDFNPRQLLTSLGKPVISENNENALTRLKGSFEVVATKNSAKINNIKLTMDDSNIQGNLIVSNFKKPDYEFDINIDAIALDNYTKIKLGSVEVKQEKKPVTKNPDKQTIEKSRKDTKSLKPVAHDRKSKKTEKPILPIETIRKINASGKLSIKKAVFQGLKLNNLEMELDAKNGVLKTHHSMKPFYQGQYVGNLRINANNHIPKIQLKEKLTRVKMGPLLKDYYGKTYLTGTLNGDLQLQGTGNTQRALKRNATGKIKFDLKNGKIYGFNLEEIVKKGKALLKNEDYKEQKKYTEYTIITASATVNKGLLRNKDLYAESERLRVSGKGAFNLINEKLDYYVLAKLMKRKKTPTDPEQVKRTLGINISGPLKQLVYTLDLKSLITETEKQKLIKKAEKKLGKDVGNILKQLLK